MPMKKHEMIYVFYDKLPFYDISSHKHKFIENNIGTYCYGGCDGTVYGDITRPDFKGRDNTSIYDPPLPKSILQFKNEKQTHKTQKPVSMMNWILKYYSKENDVILDPTMGSGSMGISCKEMNREFIGFERDEDIYKVACNRLDYQSQ